MSKVEIKKISDMAHDAICKNDFMTALQCYYKILSIDPNDDSSLHFLSFIFNLQGQHKTALEMVNRAIDRYKCSATYYTTLASIQRNLCNYPEAIKAIDTACQLKPNDAVILSNAAMILGDERKYEQSKNIYEIALEFEPDNSFVHFNYALLLLTTGNFKQGWQEYEWRIPFHVNSSLPTYPKDLKDKKIRIIPEQGYGDFIMFSRFFESLRESGVSVFINCPKALEPLYECHYCPNPDFSINVMSLASLFDFIPNEPYIKPPGKLKLPKEHKLKIGLAPCAVKPFSNSVQVINRENGSVGIIPHPSNLAYLSTFKRSLPHDFFDPLINKNHKFYNLQKDSAEIFGVEDMRNDIKDFGNLADLVDQMDLIITVDTALAHLAGAMGKDTWLLLPYDFEWRWQADRKDSPWYPSMRIFRQQKRGNWNSVQDEVYNELT